jgi:predicted MPP superfamily phosphohydrolase
MLVIGDFGSGVSTEDHVAAAMADVAKTRNIDAFVTTGDNLYKNDVDSTWKQPFGWVDQAGIPVFAAWGNHDVASGARARAVQDALNPPGNWYWVRIGPANLVVLDGNDPTNQDQLDWLDETLPNLPPGPTLVSFHQPAYSCASHGSTKAIDEEWVPRFEKAGVDLVLNGHDHDYQRFEVSGITYVVTGAGGRGLYSVGSCPKGTPDPIASNDTDHSFMVITVSADQIQAQAISNHGDTLDDFSLQTS